MGAASSPPALTVTVLWSQLLAPCSCTSVYEGPVPHLLHAFARGETRELIAQW